MLFERGNEGLRADYAVTGVTPARQRFRADQFSRPQINLGLEEWLDLPLP